MRDQQHTLEYASKQIESSSGLISRDTLLRVVIGIAIFGLFLMIRPVFTGRTHCTKEGEARATMSNIKSQLANFELEMGRLPTTAEGIEALMHAPPALPQWNHPYLDKLPLDPWGNPYQYSVSATDPDTFDLHSAGPDGKDGTADDIHAY